MSGADDPTVPAGQEADDAGAPLRLAPIDRYAPEARIGEGGMGVVWEAHDRVLDRKVALKVLHDRFLGADHQIRLAAEARAMARLSHPNVVAVYDAGERDGRAFVAMELVRGRSVAEWAATAPPWREVVAVFRAAGLGVAAAHAAGIVHRDLKPSNILVGDDGRVRVADFGVASADALAAGDLATAATTAGVAGTPVYMAPERLRGGLADPRSDQFSFGVSLYEVLHGQRPFVADSLPELLARVDAGPPEPRRKVPRWLHAVVARSLAADPARRFPSMAALLAALEGPRRRTRVLAAAAAVVVAGVTLAAWRGGDGGATPPPVAAAGLADAATAAVERIDLAARRQLTTTDACAELPAFVDTRNVVFSVTREASQELHHIDLGSGAAAAITSSPAWECCAAPGRTPGEVLYLETPPGGDYVKAAAVFRDVATGVERERRDLSSRAVGWGNDTLHYIGLDARLHRRTAEHDENWIAAAGIVHGLVVGPRGQVAMVESPRGVKPRLCLADADADAATCHDELVPNGRPAFSPRGDAVYFPSGNGLRRVELADLRNEKVAAINAGGGVAISPDGAFVVWSECYGRSQVVDLTSWPPRPLVAREAVRDPAVGPNGRLAWVQFTKGVPSIVVQQDGGTTIEISDPSLGMMAAPSFSPDGKFVAFQVSGKAPGIYVTWAIGGRPMSRLSDGASDQRPAWTRDGRVVFMRADQTGLPTVHVVSREGGPSKQAVEGPRVLVAGNAATGEILLGTLTDVVWWDPVTGTERPGPPSEGDLNLAAGSISPNGRWMVEQLGDGGMEIWRQRLFGDQGREWLLTLPASAEPGRLAIDDDGRIISALVRRRGELHVAPLRESPP